MQTARSIATVIAVTLLVSSAAADYATYNYIVDSDSSSGVGADITCNGPGFYDWNQFQYVSVVGDDSCAGYGSSPDHFQVGTHAGALGTDYHFGSEPNRIWLPQGLHVDPFDLSRDGVDPLVNGGIADGYNDFGQFRDITLSDGSTIHGVFVMQLSILGLGESLTGGVLETDIVDTSDGTTIRANLRVDGTADAGFRLIVDAFDGTGWSGDVTVNRLFVTEVPEPGSLALLALAGLAAAARRRR